MSKPVRALLSTGDFSVTAQVQRRAINGNIISLIVERAVEHMFLPVAVVVSGSSIMGE